MISEDWSSNTWKAWALGASGKHRHCETWMSFVKVRLRGPEMALSARGRLGRTHRSVREGGTIAGDTWAVSCNSYRHNFD